MPKARFVICGMDGSNSVEVFNTYQKNIDFVKNGMSTAKFRIRQENTRANDLMTGLRMLKIYRSTVRNPYTYNLCYTGDIISATETADESGAYIDVVSGDAFWRLTKRLVGLGVAFNYGSYGSQVDVCVIMQAMLASLNTLFHTGIVFGALGTTYNTYYGPVYFQNVGDAFTQFSATLGGPDFDFAPLEPTFDGSIGGLQTKIATMNTYAFKGTTKPEAIFEYGAGKHNVSGYQRIADKSLMSNYEYALPQGYPDAVEAGQSPAEWFDSTSQYTYTLMQDVISQSVITDALRLALCKEYIAVRKDPRQQLTFSPIPDCPVDFKQDYDIGDIVTARAYDRNSKQWIYNGTVRVYGVNINYNDEDQEQIALTLIPS